MPSATEVIVDVPSAFHTPRYQRGEMSGLRYVLHPDGSGKVMQVSAERAVLYKLHCTDDLSCRVTGHDGDRWEVKAVGAAKPELPEAGDGKLLAQYLAEWVLAGKGQRDADMQTSARVPEAPASPAHKKKKAAIAADLSASMIDLNAGNSVRSFAASGASNTARKKENPVRQARRIMGKQAPVSVFAPAKPEALQPVTEPAKSIAHQSEQKTFFQRIKLKCAITGSVTLRYKHHETGQDTFGKPRASFGCGAKLSKKLSLRLAVIGYGSSSDKAAWDPEFTYALSYKATEKLTFGYSNYSGRFSDSGSAFADSLTSGTVTASYKLPKIKLPNDKTIGCSAGISTFKFEDARANLSCGYAVTKKLRISASAYAYPSGQQDSFDPDFSYSASYKISDDWTVSYSNYANNRFFWNQSSKSGAGILGGSISIKYGFKF